jgi:hypothetical protein
VLIYFILFACNASFNTVTSFTPSQLSADRRRDVLANGQNYGNLMDKTICILLFDPVSSTTLHDVFNSVTFLLFFISFSPRKSLHFRAPKEQSWLLCNLDELAQISGGSCKVVT